MSKLVSIAAVIFTLVCIALTVTGHIWAFLLVIVVLGPIAFYRTFISKTTRTVGQRPFVPGRDCRACGGWGNLAGGSTCHNCGGRQTR
jgi:fatty-acid desaturase